jgi:hypothetical protein
MYDQAKSKTEIVLNEEEENQRYFPLFTKLQSNATSKSNNFIVCVFDCFRLISKQKLGRGLGD